MTSFVCKKNEGTSTVKKVEYEQEISLVYFDLATHPGERPSYHIFHKLGKNQGCSRVTHVLGQ